jgi:hypothetical protein
MNGIPILIHPRSAFDTPAAIPTGCRVVTTERLDRLREALGRLLAALADNDAFRDPMRTSQLLVQLGVTPGPVPHQVHRPSRASPLATQPEAGQPRNYGFVAAESKDEQVVGRHMSMSRQEFGA